MTSSNGNIFRVTDPLCGEFTGHKGQWRGVLMFSLICAWTNGWVNNRDAGDLRRHRAHYDVFVMCRIAELITVRQKRPWLWPDIIYNNIPAGREHAKCLQILHGYTDDVSTLQFLMLFFIIGVYAMNTGVPKDLARFRRLLRKKVIMTSVSHIMSNA